jgi:hypothetical protein
MSEIKVNKLSPRSGTDITLGNSGTDFIVPSGATITVNSGGQIVNNGTTTGFGLAWQSSNNRFYSCSRKCLPL